MEEKKETIQEAEQRRAEMYEKCNKRLALIHSKYPNLKEAPESIQKEASELNGLKTALTARGIWGDTEASNGLFIDSFKIKRYEEALANSQSLKEENSKYISAEEDAKFEFPAVDFNEIEEAIADMHSLEDSRNVMNKIHELQLGYHSNAQNQKINELYEKWANAEIKPIEKNEPKTESMSPVKLSKFAQIYEKAKGKLRGFVGRLKDMFKETPTVEKSEEKEQDESDESR